MAAVGAGSDVLLIADVHGAATALGRVATGDEPLVILGDLINYIDYRDHSGIVADIAGTGFVEEMVGLRTRGDGSGARRLWEELNRIDHRDLRVEFSSRAELAYEVVCRPLDGVEAYVTYGNVDRPAMLRRHLPPSATFIEAGVVEIDGISVGIAGGGMPALGTEGEVGEDEMEARLEALAGVEVLCTHQPPAVEWLSRDVIGGRAKASPAVLRHIERHRPRFHYFGDVHQPRATHWRIGPTQCVNVGYFRATGRGVRHPP